MIKAKRLEALEADIITAWRTAWEQSAEAFDRNLSGLSVNTADLLQELQAELPDLTDDDASVRVGRSCKASVCSASTRSQYGSSLMRYPTSTPTGPT